MRSAYVKMLVRFAFSGGLIVWLLSSVDGNEIKTAFAALDSTSLAIALVAYFVGVGISAFKWKLLLPAQRLNVLFRLTLVGQLYSMVLPGQIAGEAVKAYRLGKGHTDAENVAASVMLDKLTGLLSLIFIGALGALSTHTALGYSLKVSSVGLFLLGTLGLFSLAWPGFRSQLFRLLDFFERRYAFAAPLTVRLKFFFTAWQAYLSKPIVLLGSFFLGVAYQLVHISILIFLSHRFGFSISLYDWMWIFMGVSLAVLLPISLGGLGVREGAFVSLLHYFGIASSAALALSLTIFFLQIVAALLGGIFDIWGVRRR